MLPFNRAKPPQVNLNKGNRVLLLVPDDRLIGARQNVEQLVGGRPAVESIESFVAQNIEELSEFDAKRLVDGLRRLLETYHQRVGEAEADSSLLVDIPPNLAASEEKDE